MGEVAIRSEGLGKRYTLGVRDYGYGTLREGILNAVRESARIVTGRRTKSPRDTLWALRDLSLTVRSGEIVGLIGHNGAGKSTLLKILSRITEPSAGWAEVTGRVGSLLEVGTGFHPELTGRENVFLNGAILGMRRAEIRRKFDEIVAFAEVEQFLDTPVKRYSSGMATRLAFAVAAHLDPEILLVDEVLAVGDAAFQRKSLGKMDEVAREGRTVLFVSHNLALIRALCHRGVLLENGREIADGLVGEVIDRYLRTLEETTTDDLLAREDRDMRGWWQSQVSRMEIRDASGRVTEALVAGRPMSFVVHVTEVMSAMECRLTIVNSFGQPIATLDSEVSAPTDLRDGGGPRIECEVPSLPLTPGRYRVDVLVKAKRQIQDGLQAAAFFDVAAGVLDERPIEGAESDGNVAIPHRWRLPA